jgi:hypothetical protein
MAKVLSTLTNAISSLNALYEGDSTAPAEGEEDFTVWTSLLNLAINLWENEEGDLWKELFVKMAAGQGADVTSSSITYSYAVATLFRSPASGYVWLGTGQNKIAYKVIAQEDVQLYENNGSNWCYFLMDTTPTLEFNPNCTIPNAQTINYNYYKYASSVSTGTDTFEMSDPGFAVYYALSELKKEEGDVSALTIATQKLEAMKTRNIMPAPNQVMTLRPKLNIGFGIVGGSR